MKALVHAIQNNLQKLKAPSAPPPAEAPKNVSWSDYVVPGDIYLAISVDYIPQGVGFPCVGIKDGPISYDHADAGGVCVSRLVHLAVYMEIPAGDEALTGSTSTAADGILAVTDALRVHLTDNLLGISGMELALPVEETEIEIVGNEFLALRKILTIEYKQWEVR